MTSPASSQTLEESESQSLDLSALPPIFVSLTHFPKDVAELLEERLIAHGATISYNPSEFRIVFSKVERQRRAQLDLRSQGVWTESVNPTKVASRKGESSSNVESEHDDGSATASDTDDDIAEGDTGQDSVVERLRSPAVKVIKVEWIEKCLSEGKLLPVEESIIFEGEIVTKPDAPTESPGTPAKRKRESPGSVPFTSPDAILARARADARETSPRAGGEFGIRKFGDKERSSFTAPYAAGGSSHKRPPLLTQTTSEHDAGLDSDNDMPQHRIGSYRTYTTPASAAPPPRARTKPSSPS